MAPLLADPELGDAAQEAMWRIFARTPNTEVQVRVGAMHERLTGKRRPNTVAGVVGTAAA
jgi:hypothetical protein